MKHPYNIRKLVSMFCLAICLVLYPHVLRAHDALVDGIYYNLNTNKKTASVTFKGNSAPSSLVTTYEGVVTIPETFIYGDVEYTVTEIGADAFNGCRELTELLLPGSIRSIGSNAFSYASKLRELVLPEGVTDIAYRAFYTSYMEKLVLPSTLLSIGDEAFMFNSCLKELDIPAATTNIAIGYNLGSGYCNPFGYNSQLLAINVDADNPKFSSRDGVLYNKDQTVLYAFPGGISGKFVMPSTVTGIEYGAFSKSQASVFFGDGLQSISPFAFSGSDGNFYFKKLPKYDKYIWSTMPDATVYVPAEAVSTVKKYCEGEVYPLPTDFPYLVDVTSYVKGLFLRLEDNPYYDGEADEVDRLEVINTPDLAAQYDPVNLVYKYVGLQPNSSYAIRLTTKAGNMMELEASTLPANVKLPSVVTYMADMRFGAVTADTDETATIKKAGVVVYGTVYGGPSPQFQSEVYFFSEDTLVSNLSASTYYTIKPFVIYEGEDDTKVYGVEFDEFTKGITMHNIIHTSSTQRTLTFKRNGMYKTDATVKVEEMGVEANGLYVPFDENDIAVVKNLSYDTKYFARPYIKYNGGKIKRDAEVICFTLDVTPKILVTQTASSLFIVPDTCSAGDAGLLSWNLYCNDVDLGQDSLFLKGLSPQQSIEIRLLFRLQGKKTESAYFHPTTLPIEFNLLSPKCITATSAIVAAETNVDPNETNVGFQWKKYDAPESLVPKEAYTILEEGKIEGIIKNLQTSSYYNVRAFYQADDGSCHYGQWLTFDPSDYSFFEPTVRTYKATEVSSNSAKVKAYVLAGTEDIIEQGFEYWPSEYPDYKAIRVKAAPAAEDNISTVLGAGQVMTVTLTGLQPNSIYCFRSFVKTASGITYGEEQTLITEINPTGIDNVESDASSATVTGFYDLDGRKYNELQKGLNIIRYSDGSVRKVNAK